MVSLSVNVPNAAAAEESKFGATTTMDDLLSGFEGELGIDAETDGGDDFDATQGAAIAAEVNLLKRASESQMEVAMKSELSLQHGESIDQYMPTENVTQIMNNIEDQRRQEIAALDKNDAEY